MNRVRDPRPNERCSELVVAAIRDVITIIRK